MIEFFVKRPVTTIMLIMVFVIMGFVSLYSLSIEKAPKVDFPIVTISVTYPGATPLEVETLVVKKIEDVVSELSEIKKIRSQSFNDFGFIYVEFLMSADVNVKSIEAKDKVEAILNDLPEDIDKPIIEKYDPLMVPVLNLVLLSDTLDTRTLYEYADKTLKNKFSSVRGVAKVDVYGGKERQIKVWLDPLLMKQHYISISEVIDAIKDKNKNIPGGLLEKGRDSLSVRFVGEFQDVGEIANMALTSSDGKIFALKEIGRVEDSFKKVESMARYNGRDVVGLAVNKVSDGNGVDISREIYRRMNEFQAGLPEGVKLEIATDSSVFIINETNGTWLNIFIGILLTVVILYLFTGQARLTFIAAIVIPTSLISACFLINGSGFTINFMTLLAIATALGTLIANAIVIIENVLVHIEHHESAKNAAIAATKEVSGAILASTGTNLVVFAPMSMMGGIVGQFMRQFGLTVIYLTAFSLLASFTLTPMLCGLLLKKRDNNTAEKRKGFNVFDWLIKVVNNMLDFLHKEYKYIFDLIFKFPKTTIVFVLAIVLSMRFVLPYIGNDFMPKDDEDKIGIQVAMPQGSTIERTLEVVKIIEARIDSLPEKKSYLTNIGENGVENAKIDLDLVPSKVRKRSDAEVIDVLIPFMAKIPGAEITLIRGEPKGGETGDVSINVYGLDYNKMILLSKQMKEIMERSGYFRSVDSSYKTPKKEIQFIPEQNKLLSYGLNNAKVGASLRSSIYGNDDNIYKEKGEEYDIHVELDDRYVTDFDDIKEITALSQKGIVPITELGILKDDKALPKIMHRDKVRVIRLEGFLSKSSLGYARNILDEEFKALQFEPGYGYTYVGFSEHQKESQQELGHAFILAVILTFMLLAALMNSTLFPLPIMMTVLTSYVGVFIGLMFANQSINIASMMGMVMLVGLVVNNAILMLDYTMIKMKEGVAVKEALWLGASVKFRAIIMTSLAIVLGVMPQLAAIMSAKKAMGVVMVGGMLASVLFTFIFVPVVFWYVARFRRKFIK